MTLQGMWRIVEMPDYDDDFPDMMGPAYILFGPTGGEFAFGCVTGSFAGGGDHDAVEFDWVRRMPHGACRQKLPSLIVC